MDEHEEASLEPAFRGTVGSTVTDSTPWWPERIPSAGPNILVILLDDVGYAQLGCYGGSAATPNIDALARNGLRYTNFHVPALCSPTRASLLTGRNHHSVGVGFLGAFDTGYPSYRAAINPAAATLPEMLKAAGYGSYAIGKWHLTPPAEMSPAGPFDQWPTQRGFDRYYGFLWGEDDQFRPELWYDQHRVEPADDPSYHLSEDIVDRTKEFVADHVTNRPGDPFLAYVAFGACHAPHQAPREYLERYVGRFDHGWDVERERVLQRQIELGVVPRGTQLSERDPDVPAWADLGEDERRLAARLQEAFAGFMEHTDAQVGRLVDLLRTQELLDDTVLILLSDNGASGEGGRNGTINEYRYFLGLDDSTDDALAEIDEIGSARSHNQYPAGWALAGNTPLQYYKRFTHGGGVRAPFIVHWPTGLEQRGVRTQFHHVIDVLPTVLDLAGVEAPEVHRGVAQLPVHGTSMRYSFADPAVPSTRRRQYFETAGNRAVVDDGWKAVAAHRPGTSFEDDRWELYRIADDFSESTDRAADEPDRLRRLQEAWWEEARRHSVLPLDDRMGNRVAALDPAMDRRRYVMLPGSRMLNHVVGPSFSERGFRVTARVRCAPDDAGVILAYGRRAFGFAFYVRDGRLEVDYNLAGRHTILTAPEPLPDQDVAVAMHLEQRTDGSPILSIHADDALLTSTEVPRLVPGGIGTLSIQCGHNSPSPVSSRYEPPFVFSGAMERVVIELDERRADVSSRQTTTEMAFQ